jgi:hypothetical protein
MKTYVLTVSRIFPKTHKRAGEESYFKEKLISAVGGYDNKLGKSIGLDKINPKLHTIRSNYNLWSKRISEIKSGNAILSIRYWSGKPYNSKQVEICQLDKNSGIGIQELSPISTLGKIVDWKEVLIYSDDNTYSEIPITTIAKNDGLSFDDFKEWFKKYDLSKAMAIIHFTSFRY